MGKEGATLGRKQTNTIAFSHESNGTVMGIDASISGDHARIGYDEDGDFLHIMDGTLTKVRGGRNITCSVLLQLSLCCLLVFLAPGVLDKNTHDVVLPEETV